MKASDLQKGEFAALFSYYKFIEHDGTFTVFQDMQGKKVRISNDIVERSMVTTGQYGSEEKVTQTELAKKVQFMGQIPFQVKYKKKVDSNDVADALEDADMSSQAKRRKVVKKAMEGETRVMHAHLCKPGEDHDFGRYKVNDLEQHAKGQYAVRQVDTRTIEEVIANGVKYSLKK